MRKQKKISRQLKKGIEDRRRKGIVYLGNRNVSKKHKLFGNFSETFRESVGKWICGWKNSQGNQWNIKEIVNERICWMEGER